MAFMRFAMESPNFWMRAGTRLGDRGVVTSHAFAGMEMVLLEHIVPGRALANTAPLQPKEEPKNLLGKELKVGAADCNQFNK
eukprot:8376-Prorocentrum_minimum.AAC.1